MSTNPVTWETISGYFRDVDIQHMKDVTGGALDLSDCESVQHWAKQIYVAVSNKVMPPDKPGKDAWTQDRIDTFKAWIDAGAPCPLPTDTGE
jgi:hypothetical protein